MKRVYLLIAVLVSMVFSESVPAQNLISELQLWLKVYGKRTTACVWDTDADTGGHNRLAELTAGNLYLISGFNPADGSAIGIECIFGSSSVDASSSVGEWVPPGGRVFNVVTGGTYVSCVPFSDNMAYQACKLE